MKLIGLLALAFASLGSSSGEHVDTEHEHKSISVSSSDSDGSKCKTDYAQKSCTDCINSDNTCAWAESYTDKDGKEVINKLNDGKIGGRCFSNPEKVVFKGVIDPAVNIEGRTTDDSVLIQPNEYDVKLRWGTEKTLEFDFKVTKSYDLDLYLLIDTTGSMSQEIEAIKNQLNKVVELLTKRVGKSLSIAVGGFKDKIPQSTDPLIDMSEVFEHKLDFLDMGQESNQGKIKQKLEEMKKYVTSGGDGPEAGMEALVSVLACQKEIGWRETSQRIVLLLTDEKSHFPRPYWAAGRYDKYNYLIPNDLECHYKKVSNNKLQHDGIMQNYPPPCDVGEMLRRHNTELMIYYTDKKKLETHYNLVEEALGRTNATYFNPSAKAGDWIGKQLVTTYDELFKEIHLDITYNNIRNLPDEYDWEVQTDCGLKSKTMQTFRGSVESERKNIKCGNPFSSARTADIKKYTTTKDADGKIIVDISSIQFFMKVKLEKFDPKNPVLNCKDKKLVKVATPGYGGSNNLEINLQALCSCQDHCNSEIDSEDYKDLRCTGAAECGGNGEFKCGKCVCKKGWTGKCCQCYESSNQSADKSNCKTANGDVCAKRGICNTCGACECSFGYFGDKCQCSEQSSCPVNPSTNVTCSGKSTFDSKDPTKCNDCRKCECKTGYQGNYCQCGPGYDICGGTNSETWTPPVCSGVGTCSTLIQKNKANKEEDCNTKCACPRDSNRPKKWRVEDGEKHCNKLNFEAVYFFELSQKLQKPNSTLYEELSDESTKDSVVVDSANGNLRLNFTKEFDDKYLYNNETIVGKEEEKCLFSGIPPKRVVLVALLKKTTEDDKVGAKLYYKVYSTECLNLVAVVLIPAISVLGTGILLIILVKSTLIYLNYMEKADLHEGAQRLTMVDKATIFRESFKNSIRIKKGSTKGSTTRQRITSATGSIKSRTDSNI